MKAFNLKFALITLAVLSFPSALRASVVVTDGEFGSHWISSPVTTGVGAASGTFSGAENRATGGNPGAYRWSSQVHGGRGNFQTFRLFNLDTSFVFDPSLGPLNELTISFDGILFSSQGNQPVQFGAAVRQNGRLFHHDPGASGTGSFSWQSFAFDLLNENDFVPSEPAFQSAVVDFSSTGSPIEFGYFAFVSNFFLTTAETGADNWRLVVNPQSAAMAIPEPSTLAVWLLLGPMVATRQVIMRWKKKTKVVTPFSYGSSRRPASL